MNTVVIKWLEILVYELIDLFPNLILALVPFRSFLRLSRKKSGLLLLLLYLFLCVSRFLAFNHLSLATMFSVLWILLYLGFYVLSIHAEPGKLFFVLLMILNYGSFVAIIYSYIISHYLPKNGPYSFSSSLILFLIYLVSYPIVYRMMRIKIRPLMEATENNRYWHFLWLVPATFCLSYYYNLFSNDGIIPFSREPGNVLFAALFNVGGLFVTYLTAHLIEVSNENMHLTAENYQLNMQAVQYDNLQNRIEEARRANHDLRQVLSIINTYLRDCNYKGLLTYINHYTQSLPSLSPIAYCNNYAVNALIVYYESLASKNKILFHCSAAYPDETHIADTDITVLLGNLLENAIEACNRQQSGATFLSLHIKKVKNMLVITLDNSCNDMVEAVGDVLLSSKDGRPGIGTDSVRKIAEKYSGLAKFTYGNNQFHSSVMLYDGEPSR